MQWSEKHGQCVTQQFELSARTYISEELLHTCPMLQRQLCAVVKIGDLNVRQKKDAEIRCGPLTTGLHTAFT